MAFTISNNQFDLKAILNVNVGSTTIKEVSISSSSYFWLLLDNSTILGFQLIRVSYG